MFVEISGLVTVTAFGRDTKYTTLSYAEDNEPMFYY